jgi:hypothetical protein
MVIFLVLVGYMGIRNINVMQEINKQMFDDILGNMKSITTFKRNLTDFKDNYFQSLLDGKDNPYVRNSLYGAMEASADAIKIINEKKGQKIIDDLNEMKTVADLPVNKENYALLSPKITTVSIDINEIEYDIQGKSYTMSSFSTINSVKMKQIAFVIIVRLVPLLLYSWDYSLALPFLGRLKKL